MRLLLALLCCLAGVAHATPAAATAHKAYISLIIDDLGQNLPGTVECLPCPAP